MNSPRRAATTVAASMNADSSTAEPGTSPFYGSVVTNALRRTPLKKYQSFTSIDSSENVSFAELVRGIPGRLIRRGSVIVAATGERRHVGFRASDATREEEEEEDLERQPLLGSVQRTTTFSERCTRRWNSAREWIFSHNYHHVCKCSVAYLLASLAVYSLPLSTLLGKSDSKHVVATVAVYFHPARTFGSMHQAVIFVIFALLFSFSVSLLSTGIASAVYRSGYRNASALINLLFASISLGFVSYMKQKMNHPTFNVACSLASISLISAIVKEGARDSDSVPFDRLLSLFKIVVLGSIISVFICYTIFPSTAEKKLKQHLNESCSLMSQYLSQIESSFINNRNITSDDIITQLNNQIKKNATLLKTDLDETRYELCILGREQEYDALTRLVRSVQLLESQLGGLKGSAEMQWEALHEHNEQNTSSSTSVHTLDSDHAPHRIISTSNSVATLDESAALNSKQLFDLFIYYLGPSLKSFSYTIRGVLDGMPFEAEEEGHPAKEAFHYRNSLRLASELFQGKYERALSKLYAQSIFQRDTPLETKINEEEVAASCGNFASILSQYSKELDHFVDLLTRYAEIIEEGHRSWNWLVFWKKRDAELERHDPGLDYALENLNSSLNPRSATTDQRRTWGYRLWEFFSFFRRVEVQFGIRVGLGAFALASLAFLPDTKQIFMEWRGEWALVTYSIIMNKSLGGTYMTVNWRFLGTFLGAAIAYVVWTLSDGNVYALCLTGWLISLYSFHIILNWKDVNAFGRFILLTYNITALYSYNTTRSDDWEEGDQAPIIGDIALHRFLGIAAGVVWALLMTVSFLPLTARNRLKRGLSVLWLRLGVVWNSDPLEYRGMDLVGLADQRGVVHIMNELGLALKQAPKETRLKGKFRADIYRQLLDSTEKIIDAFQNMNTMISVEPRLNENELRVLQFTEAERMELQNRVFLIFYMISSSIVLGIPLPSKPASTEHSRDRLMVKLGQIRQEGGLADEDYVLMYSYILISNVITRELNKIIALLGDLFGVVDAETFQI